MKINRVSLVVLFVICLIAPKQAALAYENTHQTRVELEFKAKSLSPYAKAGIEEEKAIIPPLSVYFSPLDSYLESLSESEAHLIQDYARLSNAVYSDDVHNIGLWDIKAVENRDEYQGLYAAAFLNSASGELVFVFRGTESFNDINTDIFQLYTDELQDQYRGASQFFEAMMETLNGSQAPRVTTTGHSLGGALAQYIAAKYGTYAVTFNSAGLGESSLNDINLENLNYQRFPLVNFKVANEAEDEVDFVSQIGTFFGETVFIQTHEEGFIDLHKMDTVLDAIETLVTEYQPYIESLFEKAETNYPALFSPSHTIKSTDGYFYRDYENHIIALYMGFVYLYDKQAQHLEQFDTLPTTFNFLDQQMLENMTTDFTHSFSYTYQSSTSCLDHFIEVVEGDEQEIDIDSLPCEVSVPLIDSVGQIEAVVTYDEPTATWFLQLSALENQGQATHFIGRCEAQQLVFQNLLEEQIINTDQGPTITTHKHNQQKHILASNEAGELILSGEHRLRENTVELSTSQEQQRHLSVDKVFSWGPISLDHLEVNYALCTQD